jgi:hypothetical protein
MALLMLLSLGECVTTTPDACGWLKEITPSPGFQTRWTRDEKVQVEALDEKIDTNCGEGI